MTRYYIESMNIIATDNNLLIMLESLEKRLKEKYNTYERYNNIKMVQTVKHDLKLIQKLQRKVNGYKNIIITTEGEYDSYTTIIDFPKGTRKDFKHQWLTKNNYPTESEHYNVNSMYDCTGKVHSVYVTYDKNKVIITSYRDL